MPYKEDDLTEGLIQYHQQNHLVEVIEPEAHYQDYGQRGTPDLYVIFTRAAEGLIESHLIEVKSDHAIRAATGANEIIRQFNRMRYHFYEDEKRPAPEPLQEGDEVVLVFELAFIPSEYALLHLLDNKQLYNTAIQTRIGFDKLPSGQTNSGIHSGVETDLTFRHPNAPEMAMSLVSGRGRSLPPSRNTLQPLWEIDRELYKTLVQYL